MCVLALVWCVIEISPILHHSYFNYFMFDFKCSMKYLYFLLISNIVRTMSYTSFLISLLDHPCNRDSFYSFFSKFSNKDDIFEKSRSLNFTSSNFLYILGFYVRIYPCFIATKWILVGKMHWYGLCWEIP
jgi:hypothetical protein